MFDKTGFDAFMKIFSSDSDIHRPCFTNGPMGKYWNHREGKYEEGCNDMMLLLNEILSKSPEDE